MYLVLSLSSLRNLWVDSGLVGWSEENGHPGSCKYEQNSVRGSCLPPFGRFIFIFFYF